MTTPPFTRTLLAAYVATVVTGPDGAVWSGDGAVERLPLDGCWVITAHNPFSERLPDEVNEAANARLLATISSAGAVAVPVDGCAADHSWCEPAYAVPDTVGLDDVLTWARDFGQHAVFHLTGSAHAVVLAATADVAATRPRRAAL